MTTPLVTVANSIIEFILSLLRDPAALAELKEDPDAALAKSKVSGICAEDVRAVAPIIYDHPDVVPRVSSTHTPSTPTPVQYNHDVLNEITRITNNWATIDSRTTIVDQSVNQNIWTEGGDVTQIFDQTAGVASGDGSTAAGDDVVNGPQPDDMDDDPTAAGDDVVNGPQPDDDTDDDPTPSDLPGPQDVVDGLGDGLDQLDAGLDQAEEGLEAPATDGTDAVADDAPPPQPIAPQPAEQLSAAEDAGVPQEAVTAAQDAAAYSEPPAADPVYDAPVAEVDEAVWSEPVDTLEVEEAVYPDELGEEQ